MLWACPLAVVRYRGLWAQGPGYGHSPAHARALRAAISGSNNAHIPHALFSTYSNLFQDCILERTVVADCICPYAQIS